MTMTAMKTKAEMALVETFAQTAATLPGRDWVREARRAALEDFTTTGLPHRRVEEWKYTDVSPLFKTNYKA